jgi:DNA-binding response OmpR family regulator
MKRMLVIEDDDNLMRGIVFAFEKDGFSVMTASTIKDGQIYIEQNNIDIIILDIGLPDGSGLELCRSIRKKSDIPIIMLTACDLETDEVSGFAAGADDYVTKPFSLSVLRARVEAVLRRLETKENRIIQSGVFKLDLNSGKVFKGNEEISVSATEYKLLSFFMNNAGQILSKEQILDALWDKQGNFVDENTLSVNISRLRAKIEDDPKSPKIIKTIHGMGYVWVKG